VNTGEYRHRRMEESDRPAVEAILARQEKQLGMALDHPPFERAPVLATLVIEEMVSDTDPDTGAEYVTWEIRGAVYVEATAEVVTIGTDAEFSEYVAGLRPELESGLRRMGYRFVRAFVPRRVARFMDRFMRLSGAENLDRHYSHYYYDLR